MFIQNKGYGSGNFGPIGITCPKCGRAGTFNKAGKEDLQFGEYWVGHRQCPNQNCNTHVFVVADAKSKEVLRTYPPLKIDFDSTDIPRSVVDTLEEAITCHANECYVAAAIMVRRTLEEICADKDASGKNLKKRIESLCNKIVLPKELIEGMDDLRLLGNDAAHIEARVFQNIAKKELEIAIKFTKELLKAVYQYSSLLNELKSLKNVHKS